MNGFTKKSVGTLTLGERLKKIRSSKRISLVEASRVTKIQIKYLEYLEQGDYDHLPADVYIKGFLRSYADFLAVDEKVLLKLYKKEKDIQVNLKRDKGGGLEKPKTVNISSFVFTPKKILAALAVILFLAGALFIYKEAGSFASTPRLVILSPYDNSEIEGSSVYVEGVTDKDALLFINDQPILVSEEGKFKENLTLQSGVNVINVKSVNKFKKEAMETVTIRSNYKDEEKEDGGEGAGLPEGEENTSAQEEEMQMELRVDPGPVWLSVEADESLVFSGTMLSGAIQTFKAREKIVVNSGKGNATFLKFNGKDIGKLSEEPGAIRGLTFDRNTKY